MSTYFQEWASGSRYADFASRESSNKQGSAKVNLWRLLNGLQILLVEDERDVRDLEALILQNYGVHVTTKSSAAEAFSFLTNEGLRDYPDLLISDITMPGEDGCTFIQRVRKLKHERLRSIPAIALTSLSSDEDRQKILAAGFHVHVVKPPDPEYLAMQIAKLTGRALES